MRATIYQPAKTATQSGRANTRHWLLEFDQSTARRIDPLMGWTISDDTRQQVRLRFDTREEAAAYARAHGIEATVREPRTRRLKPKPYAENFSFYRKRGPGTEPLPRP